jgi:hypothetical protein
VPAEGALQDAAIPRPIEHGPPVLQLANAIRRLLGVELGHARVVQQLAPDHGVPEVGLPPVLRVDVGERRRDAALGHHGVCLAQQGLADERDARAGVLGLDRRPQAGPARADDEDVDGMCLDLVARVRGENHPPA